MTKYSTRMLLSAILISMLGISICNADGMKSDTMDSSMSGTMEQKMEPAKGSMEMMKEDAMKKEMKEHEMESKEKTMNEAMEKPSMESSKGMMEKPMVKKDM